MSQTVPASGGAVESLRAAGLIAEDAEVSADAPRGLDIDRLTDALIEHDWDFSQAFEACGAAKGKAGALFSQFVAESLAALGMEHVAGNVRAKDRGEHPLIDVAATHQGRLFIFDCRLAAGRAAGALARDLSRAAKLRGAEAGLRAAVVLVRPGVVIGDEYRELARLLDVTCIDQNEAFELFSKLAAVCGVERLSSALQKAEESLARRRKEGATCVFARESAATERARETSFSPAVIDLDNEWENARLQGRDWIAWVYKDRLHFRARVDRAAKPADIEKLLAERFKEFGKVKGVEKGKKSTSFEFHIEPLPGARDRLIENLEGHLRRPHDFV